MSQPGHLLVCLCLAYYLPDELRQAETVIKVHGLGPRDGHASTLIGRSRGVGGWAWRLSWVAGAGKVVVGAGLRLLVCAGPSGICRLAEKREGAWAGNVDGLAGLVHDNVLPSQRPVGPLDGGRPVVATKKLNLFALDIGFEPVCNG